MTIVVDNAYIKSNLEESIWYVTPECEISYMDLVVQRLWVGHAIDGSCLTVSAVRGHNRTTYLVRRIILNAAKVECCAIECYLITH